MTIRYLNTHFHRFSSLRALLFYVLLLHSISGLSQLRFSETSITLSPLANIPSAGYMTITNETNRAISILHINSSFFKSVKWHETVVFDGVARMRTISAPVVPPLGSIQLQRGGSHLMLFEPRKPIKTGQNIDLSFDLGSERNAKIKVPVVKSWNTHDHEKHH